jgi:hypothetical protein
MAYRAALAESNDVGETIELLQRGAARYRVYVNDRPKGFKIKTLAEFISAGYWRARRRVAGNSS